MAKTFQQAQISGDVPAAMASLGLFYDPNDSFASDYAVVVARNRPNTIGAASGFSVVQEQNGWNVLCECSLRARGMIDAACGAALPSAATAGSVAADIKLAETVGQTGLQVGTSIAGVGLGAVGGAATAGIGFIVGLIANIFAAKAAATKYEQQETCTVVAAFNPAYADLIYFIKTGQATVEVANTELSLAVNQALAGLNTEHHSSGCNTACVYGAVCKAINDFSVNFLFPTLHQQQAAASPLAAITSGDTGTLLRWGAVAAVILVVLVLSFGGKF